MKKRIITLSLLLAVLTLSSCNQTATTSSANETNATETTNSTKKIVYINTDSLMTKYTLAVELNETFLKTQEDRRTELNVKAKALEKEASEFQRKLQNNGFLSEARAREASEKIYKKQENLQKLQNEMLDKMNTEQAEMMKKLYDNITAYLKKFTSENGYDIVLSTQQGGVVMYAVDGYDVTNTVVEGLNAEYSNSETSK